MKIVLASANAGKLRELAALLAPLDLRLVSAPSLGIASPPETGPTFLDNALIKARHAAGASGLPALADDSGIEVDALGGEPGVRSARYAGEGASDLENLEKLLAALRAVPEVRRTARYRCVLAFVANAADPEPIIGEGTWEGRIAEVPRGRGGFGYDPIFVPLDGRGGEVPRTAAELEPWEKDAVSHRARALEAFRTRLGRA